MKTRLAVERMDLADTGQPSQLAGLLIDQLKPQLSHLLPLPVDDIAHACGIEEIRELQTQGFEGGLIQNPEKTRGFILVKTGGRSDRRRFTVAHELGHFLNPYHHTPQGADQFLCTGEHLRTERAGHDKRLGLEAQANEFAANFLMPENELRANSKLWGSPQVQSILDLQAMCVVSKEAAARRYVELHGDRCAIVFTRDGILRYTVCGGGFPRIALNQSQSIGRKTLTHMFKGQPGDVSDQDASDAHQWLRDSDAPRWQLWEEVLVQQDGFRMTLLLGESNSYDEDQELERSWTPRFK